MVNYTVSGAALAAHDCTSCSTAGVCSLCSKYTATGSAFKEHSAVGCPTISEGGLILGVALNEVDALGIASVVETLSSTYSATGMALNETDAVGLGSVIETLSATYAAIACAIQDQDAVGLGSVSEAVGFTNTASGSALNETDAIGLAGVVETLSAIYSAAGIALKEDDGIGCGATFRTGLTNTISGSVINSYELAGCVSAFISGRYVIGTSINAYDESNCGITLGTTPNAQFDEWETLDLVYSVLYNYKPLNLDNATVTFAAGNVAKSTANYSVVTFGNTLVVHFKQGDFTTRGTFGYVATITTADGSRYRMVGQLTISESALDLCFMHDVLISTRVSMTVDTFEREAVTVKSKIRAVKTIGCTMATPKILDAVKRTAVLSKLTKRQGTNIPCSQRSPKLIKIPERLPENINVAPCGKRLGVKKDD